MSYTEEARQLWDDVEHLSIKEIEDKIALALKSANKAGYERGKDEERKRCENIINEIHKVYLLAGKAIESVRNVK